MKTAIDKMEESCYCATLDEIRGERYEQKIRTYVGCDSYVLKRRDFSTELKDVSAIEAVGVTNYLLIQPLFYSKNQMKTFKSMEAYYFLLAVGVHDFGTKVLWDD